MSTGIRAFLAEAKAKLPLAGGVHAVIGNEASDADSIISAITVAYLRHHTLGPSDTQPTVPVVACTRRDLAFRPETIKLLQLCEIPLQSLIHVDDIDLNQAFSQGDLKLTITDHNAGSLQEVAGLGAAVCEIIDHHQDMGGHQHLPAEVRRIEFGEARGFAAGRGLGSACSLITELYLEEAPQLLDSTVSTLLAGVVLLDTNNGLNDAKVTPRDTSVIKRLIDTITQPQQVLYEMLQNAKSEPEYWAGVRTFDMLRADFKGFETGQSDTKFGISSINGGAGDLVALAQSRGDDDLQCAFAEWAQQTNSEVLIAMCCYPDGEGGWDTPKRDLIIYSDSSELRESMASYLNGSDLLQLEEVQSTLPQMQFFRQCNVASSRKQLQPLVSQFYAEKA